MPRKVLGYDGFEYFANKIKEKIPEKDSLKLEYSLNFDDETENNLMSLISGNTVNIELTEGAFNSALAAINSGKTVIVKVNIIMNESVIASFEAPLETWGGEGSLIGVSSTTIAGGIDNLTITMTEGDSEEGEPDNISLSLSAQGGGEPESDEYIIPLTLNQNITSSNSIVLTVDPTINSEAATALSNGKRIVVELTISLLNQKVRIPLDGFGIYGSTTFIFQNKLLNVAATYSFSGANVTIQTKELLNVTIQKVSDYLYYYEPNFNLDYDKALAYVLENTIEIPQACSAVRNGNYLGRNLDNRYNETAEFIVRTKATKGRHGSVSVCSMLTHITNAEANSGEWNNLYEIVPFAVLDGMNDKGVVVELNTVHRDGFVTEIDIGADLTVSTAMLGRFVLDYADSAAHAIQLLSTINIIPPPTEHMQEFHYMIADKNDTYVVEFLPDGNGGVSIEAIELPVSAEEIGTFLPISTNFYLYDYINNGTIVGNGFDRYQTLENDYYSSASKQGMIELMKSVYHADYYEEVLTNRDGTEYHTVHSSVYDFENKTLTVVPQPDNPNPNTNAYIFNVNEITANDFVQRKTIEIIPSAAEFMTFATTGEMEISVQGIFQEIQDSLNKDKICEIKVLTPVESNIFFDVYDADYNYISATSTIYAPIIPGEDFHLYNIAMSVYASDTVVFKHTRLDKPVANEVLWVDVTLSGSNFTVAQGTYDNIAEAAQNNKIIKARVNLGSQIVLFDLQSITSSAAVFSYSEVSTVSGSRVMVVQTATIDTDDNVTTARDLFQPFSS